MTQKERVLQILKTCSITNPSLNNLIADIECDDVVVMDGDTWDEMNDQCDFLSCLEACGVDNWYGYDYAQDMFADERK